MATPQPNALRVAGVQVQFPAGIVPFPAQRAVVAAAVRAMTSGSNALLESPTGTGKTLALLSAALGWQAHQRQAIAQERAQAKQAAAAAAAAGPAGAQKPKALKRARPPRVFFATRTHSQLHQVSKELKRCQHYLQFSTSATVPSTGPHTPVVRVQERGTLNTVVLASREHTCVHRTVSKSSSKNDDCKALVRDGSCPHFQNAYMVLKDVQPGWSIEDLVSASKRSGKHGGCPYFAARTALSTADVVMCPYNYLVDPRVRDAMSIDVTGAVVVLDESHNIADAACEAASGKCTASSIDMAVAALTRVKEEGVMVGQTSCLITWLRHVQSWLACQAEFEHHTGAEYTLIEGVRVWAGAAMQEQLDSALSSDAATLPIVADCLTALREAVHTATSEQKGDSIRPSSKLSTDGRAHLELAVAAPAASRAAAGAGDARNELDQLSEHAAATLIANITEGVLAVASTLSVPLGFYYGFDGQFQPDFRLVYSEEALDEGQVEPVIQLWCLNAGAALGELTDLSRSLLFASGTLSPLDGFAAELGVPCPVRVSAQHAADVSKQLLAATVSRAPSADHTQLLGVYRNRTLPAYIQGCGEVLARVCETTPAGIVAFFASYAALDSAVSTWQRGSLWARLQAAKGVFVEPRTGEACDKMVYKFRHAIEHGTCPRARGSSFWARAGSKRGRSGQASHPGPAGNFAGGALLLAVCRGKVSEGIDFADDAARAVVVIGLPYPSQKDPAVMVKRAHLDDVARRAGARVRDLQSSEAAYRAASARASRSEQASVAAGLAAVRADLQFAQDSAAQTGSVWYAQQAWRAVNQALGRALRHARDYAAIALVDSRFAQHSSLANLPSWLRPHVNTSLPPQQLGAACLRFFAQHRAARDTATPTRMPASQWLVLQLQRWRPCLLHLCSRSLLRPTLPSLLSSRKCWAQLPCRIAVPQPRQAVGLRARHAML